MSLTLSIANAPVKPADHDMQPEAKLVPLGILDFVIDLDNGPNVQSHRTRFMKRWIEFADKHQLEIELAYYPPYHSQYNPVERCWSSLERHAADRCGHCRDGAW